MNENKDKGTKNPPTPQKGGGISLSVSPEERKIAIERTLQAFSKSLPPTKVGMIVGKTFRRTLQDAAERPNPKSLWGEFWYEGECSCLFADSNIGKSIYAVQIAVEVAKTQTVVYYDFELSDKCFQLRYTDGDGALFEPPELFYRAEVSQEDYEDNADALMNSVESFALKVGAKVLVVDNLTWMANESEKGSEAAILMKRLVSLKREHGWSLLVIAHTPKRNMAAPITQNDLAGSKKLFNFFDSVFAIGVSAKDSGLRYVKQIKCRHGEFTHGAENVVVCQIVKTNAFLHFEQIGCSTEREHLKERSDDDREALAGQIAQLRSEGKTVRDIASQLGVSKSTVGNIAKGLKDEKREEPF